LETLEVEFTDAEDAYVQLEMAKEVYDKAAEIVTDLADASQQQSKETEKIREIVVEEEIAVKLVEETEVDMDEEILVEIETAVEEKVVEVEQADATATAEEAVALAVEGGSDVAESIKVSFDLDQATVTSTTTTYITLEKTEIQTIEIATQANVVELESEVIFEQAEVAEEDLDVEFEQVELDIEIAMDNVETVTVLADIPVFNEKLIDL
jgi:hypothetical protein